MLAPPSEARAAACAVLLAPGETIGRRQGMCRRPAAKRGKLVAKAPSALARGCLKRVGPITGCTHVEVPAKKCLGLFREGKTKFQWWEDSTGNEPTEKSPEFWQGTIETPRVAVSQTVTKDCCDLDDPCLCMLKKKLKEEGKEPDIWCLKKKVLVDKC